MSEITNDTPENHIFDAGFSELEQDSMLQDHLAALAFKGLAGSPMRKLVVDLSQDRKELSSGMILAVALTLADRWRETIPDTRVGVVFPAGLGGILTNLALCLLDKVPVNLNFTSGRDALDSCFDQAGIKTVITAGPVREKVGDFPWPENTIDLVKERQFLNKKSIIAKLGMLTVLPTGLLMKKFKVPQEGGNREAGLLFSSGSTGIPKGIGLTHRNIIANCLQIKRCQLLNVEQTLLACLPLFHSFGFTTTLWYPLMTGLRCITLPSPLETKRIAEAIESEKVTVLMGTPTFFRPYFKRVDPNKLNSLKYVVAGAEKTPPGFGEKWESHFGSEYLEGYGLTETSPVVSVNLPAMFGQPSQKKFGSVGKILYGMRARICHPASGEALPYHERGILELQGANVFSGYLDNEQETQASFHDGWFATGDLARIDEDGYLFIEGRVTRFSKIGGEMVPHGRIEQLVAEVFNLADSDEPLVAVTGVSDDQKGEVLVLLAAVDIKPDLLRERLVARGVPNLWIPRVIQRVDGIPSLASGKLDLQGINQLAEKSREKLPSDDE